MNARRLIVAIASVSVVLATACAGSDDDAVDFDQSTEVAGSSPAPTAPVVEADVDVEIDVTAPGEAISPLIRGVSSTLTGSELADGGLTLNSWGGNPSTRYNYVNGHAWNHGADFEFRNTNYGATGHEARNFVESNMAAGVETRLAVPTLGWVARDDSNETCSFPNGEGGCLPADQVGGCEDPNVTADPETANVESTPEMVAEWVGGMVADGLDIRFIAMDNEPELWGFTHYDVHPLCPTYEEILDKYLSHARAIRDVAPDAELAGPVMCCWYDYWRIAPGPADGSDQDFLEWFLENVRRHDEEYGRRTLDVVDVHYYPQSDVFNENTDPETNARRLRSVRSLYDPTYIDESWIDTPIQFIGRMKDVIARAYPDTPLLISEWNFGADTSMNGALAIAEVLGIYGREGVYAASYWRNPAVGSPGFFAFKMHGNYDGNGSSFEGRVVRAEASETSVSAYGAIDESSGMLRLMLINTDPAEAVTAALPMEGFEPASTARTFTYGPDAPSDIVAGTHELSSALTLPASSITVVELDPAP